MTLHLKAVFIVLSVVVACSVYICSRTTVVVGDGGTTAGALPQQPSTVPVPVPVIPTRSTDPKVNHFQELPSRYTADIPTELTAEKPLVPIPSISSADIQPCKNDTVCQENLSNSDLTHWESCVEDYRHSKFEPPVPKCRFMNGTNRGPVALASLPGSGNTWVRGILEQATGICTGSVFCDFSLRAIGMMGENIRSGTVLVVKTHAANGRKYSSGILIVRDPLDALVSEWNRRKAKQTFRDGAQHTRVVEPSFFGNAGENPAWNRYVNGYANKWQAYIKSWILSRNGLLVRYEDIKTDTVREVKRMLEFLKFPYKESELVERLATGFDDFHRASHPTFDHYTAEQRKYVRAKVKETVQLLKEWKHSSVAQIEKYL